ncbi:Dyp-type peroxidase [Myceligenerans salitolerans]|uniref:Dyp-type peroxidase n=1 Tax=Myceligenerans salitolerans TaxID=1230528 RepID=A0ABS3ID58_9MICO|nr:Dyp-type peroxidase [Myceligenerans salitolerans]MBO0609977.1 Dyp-type peroxidase [Myceligenerans salitolerans]
MDRVSRREVLFGTGGVIAGVVAAAGGTAAGTALEQGRDDGTPAAAADLPADAPSTGAVRPDGTTQAGIDRPATPQRFGLLTVLDLPDAGSPATLLSRLATLGTAVLDLTGAASAVPPGGAGDLTVTVGLGPRPVAAIDPGLPGATALPRFAGDESIAPERVGGDLLLALHGSDPMALPAALRELRAALGDATPRWSESCFRGPGDGMVARNPLGFHDGITVPHGVRELSREVWLPPEGDGGDPRVTGGTLCVLRRLVLDTARFAELGTGSQEAVIGRRLSDGAPLSGGTMSDDVDLRAKTPTGQYLVPARAHTRAAHPSFTGSGLMLRRGYGFAAPAVGDDPGETGLFFISFQRELDTFVRTQHRLDEIDALMEFATPTASASFLVLPGFDAGRPLGSTLTA